MIHPSPRAAPRGPNPVWCGPELRQRAGEPKADLRFGDWVHPMSTGYRRILFSVDVYHAMRRGGDFETTPHPVFLARGQLIEILGKLNDVSACVRIYLERRVHSRRTVIQEFGATVRAEQRLLARTCVALRAADDDARVTLADVMARVRATPESSTEPEDHIAMLMREAA